LKIRNTNKINMV